MKTTCWYEERRNLVGVFDFRSFHRFFVLVARWRWACFVFTSLFCVFFLFSLPGAFPLSELSNCGGAWPTWLFCATTPPAGLFVCCVVLFCMFFFLVALHLYIYGGISFWTHAWHLLWLKSCRKSVCLFKLSTSTSSSIRSYCFCCCCCCKKH